MKNLNDMTTTVNKMLNTQVGNKMKASLCYAFETATSSEKLEGIWIDNALVGKQKDLFNDIWHLCANTCSEFAHSIVKGKQIKVIN